ncbi:MAG: universal stress protein [Thermoanaerobaculia bacterium]|nr:universal stress protein [Thermoanaerobaculia bacterium]
MFKGIVDVLTEKAAKVFRFEEQNQLHEEVIDTGLAEIYQSHLNVAESMAKQHGVEANKTLLDGKAFQKVLDHVRKVEPWLLIVGRVGVHSSEDENGLGSNTDNLLRLCPCDILITTRTEVPALDLKAEESIHWTDEAERRMTRVPAQVKGIARTAILRLAIEKGHSVVTSDLVTEAMDRFMPKSAAEQTERLAEALAFDRAREQPTSMCRKCGVTAREASPVKCTVCGANDFELITAEMVEKIIAAEGGAEEETTYDGRKLRWTKESREALKTLTDAYQRRRAKARIEKSARGKKLATVTLEFARRFIEDEGGVLYETGEKPAAKVVAEPVAAEAVVDDPDLRLIARDRKKVPLFSRFGWSEQAAQRVLRVPAGFMRDRTQRRIEELAAERNLSEISLELVEEGIQHGLQAMAEMIGQYGGASPEMKAQDAAPKAEGETCPVATEPAASKSSGKIELALNEVSVMSKLAEARSGMSAAASKN